ncbi:MAG: nucleotidyl transferase AbiEii/AbiGii toxin family protein [Polyangiaceae bacterium]
MLIPPLTARQHVEFFHLVFLRALVARGEDKALFTLKGGCNLRFFFGSMRYSEDIDIDVTVVAKRTLENKVDRLLRSPTVVAPLQTRGIEVVDVSAPKQTETTQRWKAGLRSASFPDPLRTKVEFSRRTRVEGAGFEAVEGPILRPHGLSPFLATHYRAATAVAQKIQALAGRSAPQARDVFDLNHLFATTTEDVSLTAVDVARVPAAIERAMGLSFDEYSSQVVAYLDPDQRELFESRDAWNAMQDTVVSRLEALQ